MYNIIRSRELGAHGINTRTIKAALDCCLLKLTPGMYSIIRRCANPRHGRIGELITDEEWIQKVRAHDNWTNGTDYEFLELLDKLKIASYPHYRANDVVCGVSAAIIHGLPTHKVVHQRIQIASPTHRLRTSVVSRTTKSVPEADTVSKGKLRLTSPVRTSLDLITEIGEPGAFAAMESVLRRAVFGNSSDDAGRFGYPPDACERAGDKAREIFVPAVERLSKGQARATRLLGAVGVLSESYLESRCVYNLMMLDLRVFDQQVEVRDRGRTIARVDFMDKRTKTILLVDGAGKYSDNGGRLLQRESTQYNQLIALGYRIVRFTFAEVMDLEAFATKLFGQAPWLRDSVDRHRQA